MGKKRARTFTNFDKGTVDFKYMGLLVSRISTIFYGESILEIFVSFALDKKWPPSTSSITKALTQTAWQRIRLTTAMLKTSAS